MDARIDVFDVLDLAIGDAHVIRNAGAVATEDAIRSLILSQQALGTAHVVVMGHTDCGLHGLNSEALRERLKESTGVPAETRFGSFDNIDAHVVAQVERITAHPWTRQLSIRGVVYEVESGHLRQVAPPKEAVEAASL